MLLRTFFLNFTAFSQTRVFFEKDLIRDSTVNGENFLRLLTTRGNLLDWLTTYYLSINNKETALVPYWLAWNARTEIDRLLESGFSGTHTHTDWTLTVLLGLKVKAFPLCTVLFLLPSL